MRLGEGEEVMGVGCGVVVDGGRDGRGRWRCLVRGDEVILLATEEVNRREEEELVDEEEERRDRAGRAPVFNPMRDVSGAAPMP